MREASIVAFLVVFLGALPVALGDAIVGHEWDGSRTTPVHRLPLIDEDREEIVPEQTSEFPISFQNTCGPCHDYPTISSGWHFNASKGTVPPGRIGEPWVWVDERSGTQLPVSHRGWSGAWKPDDVGLTPWKFMQTFGRHLPGGDVAEPEEELILLGPRWEVSGKIEINCLGCHNRSPLQDQTEWAIQMGRENFRWAGTAASGFGEVTGMASRMPDTWTIYDGRNPDDTRWAVAPSVSYELTQFDAQHRALFDIVGEPEDKRCLQCHSVARVDRQKWELDGDVHSAAGLRCVDCHRNGLGHDIVRGYEDEARERGDLTVAELSCRGCHLGVPDASAPGGLGGRLAAPRPQHKGIPATHLDMISCTVCHSGPWPAAEPMRVRTSRANRLGIYGKARWYTDAPYIAEPVFMKGHDGKLAPHRVMWPAFWARLEGDEVQPIPPDEVARLSEGVLDAERQVGRVLAVLARALAELAEQAGDPQAEGQPVFVTPGRVYHLNVDGGLDVSGYEGETAIAAPVWAREKDGEVLPLVPDFDPAAEEMDYEAAGRIQAILDALGSDPGARGEPVLTLGNKVYRRTYDGLLEVSERPDDATDMMTWGWRHDEVISSLVPEFVVRAVVETAGVEESFTEEQVSMVLKALAHDHEERTGESSGFVYVCGGRMFRLASAGKLVSSDHPAAEPYCWLLAHDVRPAEQSLGARSCRDCHAADSTFFFCKATAFGPLKTDQRAVKSMHEFQGIDRGRLGAWARSARLRQVYVVGGWVAAVILVLALTRYGFAGLERAVRALTVRKPTQVD